MQFLLTIFIIYRCFSSSREASSVDDYLWLMGRAGYKPVIEYCGGTKIGGGFVTGSMLQPQALSAFSTPAMGCYLFILDSSGNPLVSSSSDGK
jgi:acyl-coenzyme A synthetase/AMP-(fatty) acid ligase